MPGLEDAVLLLERGDPGVGDHAQLQVRQPTRGLAHRRLSLLAPLLKRVTVTDIIAQFLFRSISRVGALKRHFVTENQGCGFSTGNGRIRDLSIVSGSVSNLDP